MEFVAIGDHRGLIVESRHNGRCREPRVIHPQTGCSSEERGGGLAFHHRPRGDRVRRQGLSLRHDRQNGWCMREATTHDPKDRGKRGAPICVIRTRPLGSRGCRKTVKMVSSNGKSLKGATALSVTTKRLPHRRCRWRCNR